MNQFQRDRIAEVTKAVLELHLQKPEMYTPENILSILFDKAEQFKIELEVNEK